MKGKCESKSCGYLRVKLIILQNVICEMLYKEETNSGFILNTNSQWQHMMLKTSCCGNAFYLFWKVNLQKYMGR